MSNSWSNWDLLDGPYQTRELKLRVRDLKIRKLVQLDPNPEPLSL